MNRQFILFLLTGGLAALVNMGSRWVFSHWLDYATAIVLAYLLGMFTAFVSFRQFVFRDTTTHVSWREVGWFCVINGFALAQTYVVSVGLADYVFPFAGWTLYPRDIAHIAGVLVPVVTSFFGHKYLTFRKEST